MGSKIQFKNHEVKHRFKDSKSTKGVLSNIFVNEGLELEQLIFIFCTESYLLDLNVKYLQHDTYTDILTFDLSESTSSVIAEIYISLDRVADNAIQYDISFDQELQRVMIHGILHLCGYNDHTAVEISQMRAKESYYLSHFQ